MIPTPEQFLTMPEPEETEVFEREHLNQWTPTFVQTTATCTPCAQADPSSSPLESIAASLLRLVDREVGSSEEVDELRLRTTQLQTHNDGLQATSAQLGDENTRLLQLLADVEKILKPSTSKLAKECRAAITAWRNPETEEETEPIELKPMGKQEAETFLGTAEAALCGAIVDGQGPCIRPEGHDGWHDENKAAPPVEHRPLSDYLQCPTCGRYFAEQALLDRHNCPMSVSPPAQDAPVGEWRAYARGLGYTGADVDAMNRSQIRTMLGISQPVEAAS